MPKVLMSITIDTECDKSLDWSNSDPLTFKSILDGVPNKLQPLFQAHGIKPTYFLSPEVIEKQVCAEIFNGIRDDCELGTHLHADFIEPMKAKDDLSGYGAHAFQTDFSKEVEFEKLKNLTKLFKSAFNFDPLVFRAGRYAANQNTLSSLIKLGYKVDSSFTPHLQWASPNGSIINHADSPEQPYFTDEHDIYAENNGPILEIPISIIKSSSFFRTKELWLRPKFSSFSEMKKIISKTLDKYKHNEYIIFVMMFHSQEVIPNASPYSRNEKDVKKYLELLNRIFNYAKNKNISFSTLSEIYTLFEQARK